VRTCTLPISLLAPCPQSAKWGRKLELPPVPDPLPIKVAVRKDPLPALPSGPEKIPGTPAIPITWEALAVERDRYANPSLRGAKIHVDPDDLEIVLLNASF